MRWWERSVGGPVRGRIIRLLRRQERTIDEIAAELGVTDNAIRSHVARLEREGIVHEAGVRRDGSVGKPASIYGVAPEAQALLSTAYAPVLKALLTVLAERLPAEELDALFRDVGEQLAAQVSAGDGSAARTRLSTLDAKAKAAARLLTALGAEVDIEHEDGRYAVQGHACPLSAAVPAEPHVCEAIRELVERTAGVKAIEQCDRSDARSPRCRFELTSR